MGAGRVRRYLAEQQAALLEADALLDEADRRGVHPTRVAVRRARSTLRTFDTSFADGPRRQLDAALLAHGRRFAEVRDLEVLEELLTARWAEADESTPPGLRTWLSARLADELDRAWRGALAARAAEDPDELTRRFAAVLSARGPGGGTRSAATRADRRARRRLIAAGGDPDALHRARKAAKRARYAAEALGEDEVADRHKEVQRILGSHHDLVVASRWVAGQRVLPAVVPDARRLAVRLEAAAADCLGDL